MTTEKPYGDPKPRPPGPPTGPGRVAAATPTWREVAAAITTWSLAVTTLTLLALMALR